MEQANERVSGRVKRPAPSQFQMIQNEIFCRTGIFFSRIACLSTCSETLSLVLALHLVRLLDCLLACLFRSQVWLWSLESDYDLLHARCDATVKPGLTPCIRCTLLCSCAVGPTDRQTDRLTDQQASILPQ